MVIISFPSTLRSRRIENPCADVCSVSQIVLGPWRLLNAGTGSHAEILISIALIQAVKKVARGGLLGVAV